MAAADPGAGLQGLRLALATSLWRKRLKINHERGLEPAFGRYGGRRGGKQVETLDLPDDREVTSTLFAIVQNSRPDMRSIAMARWLLK